MKSQQSENNTDYKNTLYIVKSPFGAFAFILYILYWTAIIFVNILIFTCLFMMLVIFCV